MKKTSDIFILKKDAIKAVNGGCSCHCYRSGYISQTSSYENCASLCRISGDKISECPNVFAQPETTLKPFGPKISGTNQIATKLFTVFYSAFH